MASRDYRHVLEDIQTAIAEIEQATGGKDFAAFQNSWVLRHAVQRGIEIISEASRHIPDALKQSQPDIPWRTVHGIGNVLRHEYHRVVDDVIWSVVVDELAPLKSAIEAMLVELDGQA